VDEAVLLQNHEEFTVSSLLSTTVISTSFVSVYADIVGKSMNTNKHNQYFK